MQYLPPKLLERAIGFEPMIAVLQTAAFVRLAMPAKITESHLHRALRPAYEACFERGPEPGGLPAFCPLFNIREVKLCFSDRSCETNKASPSLYRLRFRRAGIILQ